MAKTDKSQQPKTNQVQTGGKDLAQSAEQLARFGGFDILETTVEGIQNINPSRRARKEIFLTEKQNEGDKALLKRRMQLWLELLSSTEEVTDMVVQSQEKAQQAEETLNQNLVKAVDATRDLEQAYRTMAMFYKNTESDKVKNVSIVNAEMDQLTDLDVTTYFDAISEEIVQNYDRLDLRDNYSLMVIPGYMGSQKVIDKWAKMAHKNKVTLVTDFRHLDTPDDVMELFSNANHTGGDAQLSNVLMSCNWLVGREQYKELGEKEALYVPPSTSLAGKIYHTKMSQVAAGRKFGVINEVDGVRFPLKKSEISSLEKMGLVPMVKEYGRVMAFSAKTLFNGPNLGMQTYSVVRVFDYVTKVLIDFLNRRAFENFNAKTQKELHKEIVKFLDSIQGPDKLIKDFRILQLKQDPKQKDRVLIDIYMVPYFPSKSFVIKLDGQKGDEIDSPEWKAEYEQQG
ncbi:MAG: DUF5458 family protein [Bacteroidota bacterium]